MKKYFLYQSAILFLIYLGAILLFTGCDPKNGVKADLDTERIDSEEYQLVWQDEFNYSGLPDSSKWGYDTEGNDVGWGNNEAQHYTQANPKNAMVENGVLSIIALHEDKGGKEFTSARLVSKADWKYGKIEVSAKLPPGTGTWSAIWVMPGGWSFNDGNWPDIGEIDIMEHVGHDLGVVHASAHSKDYQWQKGSQKTATILIPDVSEEFHSYIFEWTPQILKAFVDDSLYFEYKNEGLGESKWPYDKPFYLILNVAVGGAWGSLNGIDADAFPQTMEVDYVRVYQRDLQTDEE
jgi:beta-glucanase (GH16 family)